MTYSQGAQYASHIGRCSGGLRRRHGRVAMMLHLTLDNNIITPTRPPHLLPMPCSSPTSRLALFSRQYNCATFSYCETNHFARHFISSRAPLI
jgi:hypothetical protein